MHGKKNYNPKNGLKMTIYETSQQNYHQKPITRRRFVNYSTEQKQKEKMKNFF